jgi:hypothetical protein
MYYLSHWAPLAPCKRAAAPVPRPVMESFDVDEPGQNLSSKFWTNLDKGWEKYFSLEIFDIFEKSRIITLLRKKSQ